MDGQGEAGIGPGWAVALETSAFGRFAREDPLLYPLASVLHVLGVGLLVGAILAFDLRVLGFGRAIPLGAAAGLLLPLARLGFLLLLVSGPVLLAADATALAANPAAWAKAGLIMLALTNVAVFHRLVASRGEPRSLLRLSAVVSALAWLGAAACGRAIAYF
ncbi:MAG: hypothetical protein NZ523_08210 [Elioraea sp.]|nr:hypothetical protein [Elioraea sp.]